jgi:hypothetical protein
MRGATASRRASGNTTTPWCSGTPTATGDADEVIALVNTPQVLVGADDII